MPFRFVVVVAFVVVVVVVVVSKFISSFGRIKK